MDIHFLTMVFIVLSTVSCEVRSFFIVIGHGKQVAILVVMYFYFPQSLYTTFTR